MALEINAEFITMYKDLMKTLLLKKNSTLTEETLQDLLQDVQEKCILYQDYYEEDKGSVGTWIGLICTHVYDRYIRSTDALDTDVEDDSSLIQEDSILTSDEHYYLHNKEQVQYYIGMLPQAQQDKLYLHLILGYTHQEIADTLNITSHSSRTLCSAAVKNLKVLVESDNPEQEVLKEVKLIESRRNTPYSGCWAWRPNESPDRSPGMVKEFTPAECHEYCQDNNIKYKYT